MDPTWHEWARQLQAIAQTGLTFATDEYDRQRYAAVCNVAAAMTAAGSGMPSRLMETLFASDAGYVTPKVDVRAAAFQEGRILLVKERADGLSTLPGDWADVGDSPRVAVERDVLEETGCEARAQSTVADFIRLMLSRRRASV